jgi:hypothetical protein
MIAGFVHASPQRRVSSVVCGAAISGSPDRPKSGFQILRNPRISIFIIDTLLPSLPTL